MDWSTVAPRIKAVALDVDGVLTDGTIAFGTAGSMKAFHARDGHAIKLARRQGLLVGLLSGRADAANRALAREIELDFFFEGEKNKARAFTTLLARCELAADEVLYVGDDVVDIPLLRRAGWGVAVADAPDEVRAAADEVTALPGGRGAVREVIARLLQAQGLWDKALERYRGPQTESDRGR